MDNASFADPPEDGNRDGTTDVAATTTAHAWRLEKRRSKYVKARQFLEEQYAETGVEHPVRSLEGLTFATWKDFHDMLHEYMKETNQTYISRDSKTTSRYNSEQIKRKVKQFVPVPIEFSHARIRFDCKHSHSNMSKNMNLFETKDAIVDGVPTTEPVDDAVATYVPAHPKRKARDGAFYSACPVKMHVQVHKIPSSLEDEWRVVVTKHVHVHNHDLASGVFPDPLQDLSAHPHLLGTHRSVSSGVLPMRLDPSKRTRALTDLFEIFTSYQASRFDDVEFHRRYATLYSFVYQSLSEDVAHGDNPDGTDAAIVQFNALLKPPTAFLANDTTLARHTNMMHKTSSSFLPLPTGGGAGHHAQQQYQL